jgi:hypothetical protein
MASSPPSVTVTTPARSSVLAPGVPFAVTGTFGGALPVTRVRVVVVDRGTGLYLTGDASWTSQWTMRLAELTPPVATGGTYRSTVPGLSVGSYNIVVSCVDTAWTVGPAAVTTIAVARPQPPPTVTITAPASSVSAATSFTVAGAFTSALPVAKVRVVVRDPAKSLYLAADGTWTSQWTMRPAVLTPPGANVGTFAATVPGLPAGSYEVAVTAVDASGSIGPRTARPVTVATGSAGGFATVLFARSSWQTPVTGANGPTLEDAVSWMSARGMRAGTR